jgi:hypothetical protein
VIVHEAETVARQSVEVGGLDLAAKAPDVTEALQHGQRRCQG